MKTYWTVAIVAVVLIGGFFLLKSNPSTNENTEDNAALVSSSMTLNSSVRVNANEDSSVNIDVLADKSLYTTTKGGYVFAPNVKVESRSDANVTTNSDSTVIIDGGTVESSGTYGMNLEGNMILNFRLDVNASFDVTGNVLKVIMGTTTTTIDLK